MLSTNLKRFTLVLVAFLLIACNATIFEEGIVNFETEVLLIEDLVDIEHFSKGALEHILEGEINRNGEAVGFHYENLPTRKGEVIQGTRTDANEHGIYEAEIEVEGIKKRSNRGRSTFFPLYWSAQEVVDAINEAYANKVYISGNTYEGLTEEGFVIRMYLDNQDKIISAFPIK